MIVTWLSKGKRQSAKGSRPSQDGRDIARSGLFDPDFYREQTGLRFATTDEAVDHFLAEEQPRDPHPLFSMDWYGEAYPDVVRAEYNPLVHFLNHGASEGRSPSAYFDTRFYLDSYPDIAAARVNALSHYLTYGASEGRDPSPWFSTADYLSAHPDVAAAGVNPLVHYARHGETEGRRLSDRPLKLDARYGVLEPVFTQWRTRALRRHRNRSPILSPRRLIVVETGVGGPNADAWTGLAEAALALGVDLEVCAPGDVAGKAAHATRATLFLFVERGDRLDGAGLEAFMAICAEEADLIVFDMFYRLEGLVFPVLQPGANPHHLRSVDSVFSRFAIRGPLVERIVARGVCEPRRLLLAALDLLEAESGCGGLHHVNAPILETVSLAAAIEEGRRQAVLAAEVGAADAARQPRRESVSVIICTKDNGVLVDQLLGHLTTRCPAVKEILVVSNQTTNLVAARTLERWAAHRMVTVIRYPEAFNFSDQCNMAAAKASGDLLLFLNDDIIGLDGVWLDRLIEAIEGPSVGIVGPKLLFPNECVQHAGMFLGYHGTAGHTMRHARLPEGDYLFMATSAREVSCVTGAVLLIRRSTFEDLGGFDIQLRSAYQDVDLCIRVRGLGQRVLYVPGATLLHLESVTVNTLLLSEKVLKQRLDERAYFLRLYEDGRLRNDRFHNGDYELNDESLRTLVQS